MTDQPPTIPPTTPIPGIRYPERYPRARSRKRAVDEPEKTPHIPKRLARTGTFPPAPIQGIPEGIIQFKPQTKPRTMDHLINSGADSASKRPPKRQVICPECGNQGVFFLPPPTQYAREVRVICGCVHGEEVARKDLEKANSLEAVVRRQAEQAAMAEQNWKAFAEARPGDAEFLISMASRFPSTYELRDAVRKGIPFGAAQEAKLRQMQETARRRDREHEQRRAEREASVVAHSRVADLSAVRAMFSHARSHGFRGYLHFHAEGLILSPAPDTGANPGALYVKAGNASQAYLGKIIGTTFRPTQDGVSYGAGERLMRIAQSPLEAAIRHAQSTGECACCGRRLTQHGGLVHGGTMGSTCSARFGI